MGDARVPVTLLTGFLGAGKTTLLNAILKDASAGRTAVIVNEFGQAGLDHDLIETARDDIALMQSGCLCCTLRGELASTVADLLARRDLGEIAFDRIVLETTGLAEPGPIIQTLVSDGVLARATRLDGVVTVVDAVNGPATLEAQFEAVSQVALADLIVLSKAETVGAEARDQVMDRLREINRGARIVPAAHGEGLSGILWGLSAAHEAASVADGIAWTTLPATTRPAQDALANLSGLAPAPETPQMPVHDTRIATASIVIDAPLDGETFDTWLNDLVVMRGEKLLRVKGIVFLDEIDLPFIFHGVQHIFDRPVPLRNWTGGARQSRVVVIARDIAQGRLERLLGKLAEANAARARKIG